MLVETDPLRAFSDSNSGSSHYYTTAQSARKVLSYGMNVGCYGTLPNAAELLKTEHGKFGGS